MKDIPIIFSGPMVRAVLDGRKTRTRRLASSPLAKAEPGDRLWVRENFQLLSFGDYEVTTSRPCEVRYAATERLADCDRDVRGYPWRPSIHMPRWASRLTLIVEAVKVERLQDISEEDARAEGVEFDPGPCDHARQSCEDIGCDGGTYCGSFRVLWNSLHGPDAWDANPWVVALTFQAHRCNIDALTSATPAAA